MLQSPRLLFVRQFWKNCVHYVLFARENFVEIFCAKLAKPLYYRKFGGISYNIKEKRLFAQPLSSHNQRKSPKIHHANMKQIAEKTNQPREDSPPEMINSSPNQSKSKIPRNLRNRLGLMQKNMNATIAKIMLITLNISLYLFPWFLLIWTIY